VEGGNSSVPPMSRPHGDRHLHAGDFRRGSPPEHGAKEEIPQ